MLFAPGCKIPFAKLVRMLTVLLPNQMQEMIQCVLTHEATDLGAIRFHFSKTPTTFPKRITILVSMADTDHVALGDSDSG